MLKRIAVSIPFEGRIIATIVFLVVLACFSPVTPSLANMVLDSWKNLELSTYASPLLLDIATTLQFLVTVPICGLCAIKWLYPSKESIAPQPAREVTIGDMTFSESALFTNIMITGQIGSGKTSSAIYPILDQICQIYNVWDEKTNPDNPYKKWGGLVMDVKGDFYEALICLLHWSGRNVLEDLVVITPWANYAYAEMIDPDTNQYWYVCMRGGSSPESIEFNSLLDEFTMPGTKIKIPLDYLTDVDKQNENMPGTQMSKLEYFRSLEFHPTNETNYIGWRDTKDGKLVRIARTSHELKEELYTNGGNSPIIAERPTKLKYLATRFVNNGLTFNIAPPSLNHIELANRLVAMSKNSSGKSGGGDNSFWDDATKKHIQWVIYMLRIIRPGVEVTALDINAHTVSKQTIEKSVKLLSGVIADTETQLVSAVTPAERQDLQAKITILNDVREYFVEEWAKLDERTKSNLVSTITNVFTQFLSDPRLRTVFCSTTAVAIDEIMQQGKIYTLVAPEYEAAARVFGTSLKMEFQAILRRRTARAEYDKTRFVAFICDEVQNFVTTGGNDPTSGDENFMALSRQSKVCNVVATQTDASIINVVGKDPADVYYAQFGSRLWYQNTDQQTNERAAKILGKEKKRKVSTSGQDISVAGLLSKDGSAKGYSENESYESKEKYPAESFSNLNVHQCVIYNKAKKGKREKSCKCQLKPHYIGAPNMIGEKAKVLRWYFRAYIENRLFELGDINMINHQKETVTKAADVREEVKLPDAQEIASANTGISTEGVDIDIGNAFNFGDEVKEEITPESVMTSKVADPISSYTRVMQCTVQPPDQVFFDDDPPESDYTPDLLAFFEEIDRGIPIAKPKDSAPAPTRPIEETIETTKRRITEVDSRLSRGMLPHENVTNMMIKDPIPVRNAKELIDGADTIMSNIREGELPNIRSTIAITPGEQLVEILNPETAEDYYDPIERHKRISEKWAEWQYDTAIHFRDDIDEPEDILEKELSEDPKEHAIDSSHTKSITENKLPMPKTNTMTEDVTQTSSINSRAGSFRRLNLHKPLPNESNINEKEVKTDE